MGINNSKALTTSGGIPAAMATKTQERKLKTEEGELTIVLTRVGSKRPNWDKTYDHFVYKAELSIKQDKLPGAWMRVCFDFYGSSLDFEFDVDPNPLEALQSYVSNAEAYMDSKDMDDFDAQFNSEDMKLSERIQSFEGSKKAWDAFRTFGFDEVSLPTLDVDVQAAIEAEEDAKRSVVEKPFLCGDESA